MIRVKESSGKLYVTDRELLLNGKQRTHLLAIGLKFNRDECFYFSDGKNILVLFEKVISAFNSWGVNYEASNDLVIQIEKQTKLIEKLQNAKINGGAVKNGNRNRCDYNEFLEFINSNLFRKLKDHQIKSAIHLLEVINGANFSVPGSGKTTVVLSVYLWLKYLGLIDALFVVGPPSCFGPWQNEYQEVTKKKPKVKIFAGGDALERQKGYRIYGDNDVADLYLTTFQTLQRDVDLVVRMFREEGKRFFLVVDEAHYIKQLNGAWAIAVLSIAAHAERRCILSGTPFPKSYTDSFNLFDVLWPDTPPITASDRLTIQDLSQEGFDGDAIDLMKQSIDALFYRVRKKD